MPRSRLGPLAAFAAFGVFWGTWGVLLPEVKEQVDASVAELGAALLFISLGALPAMVVAGRLSDRLGGRLVAPALLLFAGAIVLPGLAHSVLWLGIALVTVGAASGALDVAINTAATAEEVASGARFIQIAHALFSAGFLVSALAVGLARQAGADPLPVLAGVATLLVGVAWLNAGLPRAPHRAERRRLTVSRRLLVLGALCAVAFVVESGIENWSALPPRGAGRVARCDRARAGIFRRRDGDRTNRRSEPRGAARRAPALYRGSDAGRSRPGRRGLRVGAPRRRLGLLSRGSRHLRRRPNRVRLSGSRGRSG
jgi:MFS family permease